VKVSNYIISVVKNNVDGRIGENNSGKASYSEEEYESKGS